MQAGTLTARALTEAYLARIRELDPQLKSVPEVNPDPLAIADALDGSAKPRVRANMRSPHSSSGWSGRGGQTHNTGCARPDALRLVVRHRRRHRGQLRGGGIGN